MKISGKTYFGLWLFSETALSNALIHEQLFVNFPNEREEELLKMGVDETQAFGVKCSIVGLFLPNHNRSSCTCYACNKELGYYTDYLTSWISTARSNKNYILKPEIFELSEKIKLNKFRFEWLNNLREQKSTYLVDKDNFYRFYKIKNELVVGFLTRSDSSFSTTLAGPSYEEMQSRLEKIRSENILEPNKEILAQMKMAREYNFEYNFFSIHLKRGDLQMDNICWDLSKIRFDDEDLVNSPSYPLLKQFIQLVMFICLSRPEIEILLPNTKNTATKAEGKIINSSSSDVIIVGSKWNTISVRTEGFRVGGHFRLQPCGKGRRKVKLIWVDTFEKHGYIRRSNKDTVN